MDLRIQEHCENIDWENVSAVLRSAGMAHHAPETHKKAFLSSFLVVFLFDREKLVGFGRAISDGAYQAAVYDVVVVPDCQKQGFGRLIMERILQNIANCNTILYANPGREPFYGKLGFRPLQTAMAKFVHPEIMKQKGIVS
jgi:GNAT superfamily N-acetyltransferase